MGWCAIQQLTYSHVIIDGELTWLIQSDHRIYFYHYMYEESLLWRTLKKEKIIWLLLQRIAQTVVGFKNTCVALYSTFKGWVFHAKLVVQCTSNNSLHVKYAFGNSCISNISTDIDVLSVGPLRTNFSEISNWKNFHSWNWIWKDCHQKGGHFFSASTCLSNHIIIC